MLSDDLGLCTRSCSLVARQRNCGRHILHKLGAPWGGKGCAPPAAFVSPEMDKGMLGGKRLPVLPGLLASHGSGAATRMVREGKGVREREGQGACVPHRWVPT